MMEILNFMIEKIVKKCYNNNILYVYREEKA